MHTVRLLNQIESWISLTLARNFIYVYVFVCVCPDLLICELYRVWHSALGVFVSVLVTTEKYVEIFHPNNCGTFSNVCFMYSFSLSRRRKEIFQTRNCTCLPSHQQWSCWLFLAVDAYLNTSVNDFLFSFSGQKNAIVYADTRHKTSATYTATAFSSRIVYFSQCCVRTLPI